MDLTNEVRVAVPIDKAWDIFTDIEFIAPCMPGAQLLEVDGDEYKGQIKIKVGPITAQYQGTAKFISKDKDTHTLVMSATGRDSRGAGNAAAEIKAQMTPDGDGTAITITTTLKVTGKVAQFGRGVMASVSEKLIDQFAKSLEAKLEETGTATPSADGAQSVSAAANSSSASSSGDDTASSGPRKINMPEPEPVDLLANTDTTLVKKIAPYALGLLLLLLMRRRRRRRRRNRDAQA